MFGATLFEVPRMGGRGGRPKRDEEGKTRQVRVNDDLAYMIGWIVRFDESLTSATLLDPMIRDKITALFEPLKPQVAKIEAAEAAAKEVAEKAIKDVTESKKPRRKASE